ncbi:thioredoxin [Tannockella kyphosi]|uniref:thioredoxin n=1 Tax=Tannockella kyphosi TaxID=2899121 RepID=UPI0020120C5D|nr:thioredoxin [Tannockella kyphosi]
MKIITEKEFDDVIKSGVVLVDFFANWCGPCKMLTPVLEDLSASMPNVTIVKVDVDNDGALAGRYGIQSIPNLIIFKDGRAVDQVVGFTSKGELQNKLEAHL